MIFVKRRRSAGETHRITVLPVMLFLCIVQLIMERSIQVTTYDSADEYFSTSVFHACFVVSLIFFSTTTRIYLRI